MKYLTEDFWRNLIVVCKRFPRKTWNFQIRPLDRAANSLPLTHPASNHLYQGLDPLSSQILCPLSWLHILTVLTVSLLPQKRLFDNLIELRGDIAIQIELIVTTYKILCIRIRTQHSIYFFALNYVIYWWNQQDNITIYQKNFTLLVVKYLLMTSKSLVKLCCAIPVGLNWVICLSGGLVHKFLSIYLKNAILKVYFAFDKA